jgi:hypothetical protein
MYEFTRIFCKVMSDVKSYKEVILKMATSLQIYFISPVVVLQCECDVGWTGSDCSADCGCHQHSRCSQGRGRCERCEHHTAGPACASCALGSWGNATTAAGCRPCQCNGHEDSAAGTCDATTGDCFCLGSRVFLVTGPDRSLIFWVRSIRMRNKHS